MYKYHFDKRHFHTDNGAADLCSFVIDFVEELIIDLLDSFNFYLLLKSYMFF